MPHAPAPAPLAPASIPLTIAQRFSAGIAAHHAEPVPSGTEDPPPPSPAGALGARSAAAATRAGALRTRAASPDRTPALQRWDSGSGRVRARAMRPGKQQPRTGADAPRTRAGAARACAGSPDNSPAL